MSIIHSLSLSFIIKLNASILFSELREILPGDILYVSSGEKFISPPREPEYNQFHPPEPNNGFPFHPPAPFPPAAAAAAAAASSKSTKKHLVSAYCVWRFDISLFVSSLFRTRRKESSSQQEGGVSQGRDEPLRDFP